MGPTKPEKRILFEQEAMPHLDALFTAALYLTHSQEEANDLCQETILRAYRSFHQFAIGTNCRAWLLTILHNLFRTNRSRAGRESVSATCEEFDRAIEIESLKLSDSQKNPEAIVAERDFDRSVQRALEELPAEFKAAVVLVDLEDLTYRDAAEVLEVPIGTVRSRVSRGRALIRVALGLFADGRRVAGLPARG
jgi:RNA polymerase sigma-70 factor (ECF subfamily)